MDGIRISLDKKGYRSKPESCEAARINSRIGKYVEILDSPGKICSFVRDVGNMVIHITKNILKILLKT